VLGELDRIPGAARRRASLPPANKE